MSDNYLITLAKIEGNFTHPNSSIKFLEFWYGFNKHYTKILAYLDSKIFSTFIDQSRF